ncbi:MAG: hypothetical protein HYV97_15880 [Bdellovibrio sp.]|nr:hypothetical protein [Bdellovibrio sp.]
MSATNGTMIFQFFKEINLPIYLKMESEGFGPDFFNFLRSMHFERLSTEDEKKFEKDTHAAEPNGRILELKTCTPLMTRQMNSAIESDKYGPESITNNGVCKVYRFKGMALMIWAFQNSTWEMAFTPTASLNDNLMMYRAVFNRFLSWALAPLGICGFWGHFTNGGVIVKKMREAHGEAIFFDVLQKRILGPGGIQKISSGLTVYRLDARAKLTTQMTKEEFAAFLFHSTSYFDLQGLSMPIRQAILWLTKTAVGVITSQVAGVDTPISSASSPGPGVSK